MSISVLAGSETDQLVEERLFSDMVARHREPRGHRRYSKDLVSAWLVVERLRELGWEINIMSAIDVLGTGDRWRVELSDDEPMIGGGVGSCISIRGPHLESGPTVELAICRVALAATREQDKVLEGAVFLPTDYTIIDDDNE